MYFIVKEKLLDEKIKCSANTETLRIYLRTPGNTYVDVLIGPGIWWSLVHQKFETP